MEPLDPTGLDAPSPRALDTERAGREVPPEARAEGDVSDSGGDVHPVALGDRQILLVGTAHVSRDSAELVHRVIRDEHPDHVCVELDQRRYVAMSQKSRWDELDLRQLIRRRQLSTLVVNLLLAAYQKKLGGKLGVLPGTELLEAVRSAEERGVPYRLVDRDVRVTLLRAWRSMSMFQKWKLLFSLVGALFDDGALTEEDLRRLRSQDVLSELMQELARALPSLKRVLIDERDTYLATRIREAPGKRIVAVLGAGHVDGVRRALESDPCVDLGPLDRIPPPSPVWKWVGWSIPALILGSLGWIGWSRGGTVAGENIRYWILANGIPSSLGALLALAHPLTILAAFLAAPLTSLTPVIGAGYVTAFVQAYVCPPRVRDFHSITEDAGVAGRWWSNRLLRVLLAFVFPGLGSMIGTYVGGAKIVSNLF